MHGASVSASTGTIVNGRPRIQGGRKEMAMRAGSTASHLARYLEAEKVPTSLSRCIRGLINYWVDKRIRGFPTIFPGVDKFSEWGRCKERQAQYNLRKLEAWGIMIPVKYQAG